MDFNVSATIVHGAQQRTLEAINTDRMHRKVRDPREPPSQWQNLLLWHHGAQQQACEKPWATDVQSVK